MDFNIFTFNMQSKFKFLLHFIFCCIFSRTVDYLTVSMICEIAGVLTLKNLNYKNKALKEKALNRALNENEQKVLSLISKNPKITQNEIKEQLQLARSHVQKIMKSLSDKEIERIGSKKAGYWSIKE